MFSALTGYSSWKSLFGFNYAMSEGRLSKTFFPSTSLEGRKLIEGALTMPWSVNTLGAKSMGTRTNTTCWSGFSFNAAYALATRANSVLVALRVNAI